MASTKQTGEVLFSRVVSNTAKITVSPDLICIDDGPETHTFTFDGGSDLYDITTTINGSEKRKSQTISISKKLPVCPISKLTITDKSYVFKEGYIQNRFNICFDKEHNVDMPIGYYCKLAYDLLPVNGCAIKTDIYAMIKLQTYRDIIIEDCKRIIPMLELKTNSDVAEVIIGYYIDLMLEEHKDKKDVIFSKEKLNVESLYHKEALKALYKSGCLELGVSANNVDIYTIIELTEESYNHVYYGKYRSKLKNIFKTCDEMLQYKKRWINYLLLF
jgi:hypothetical protein